MSRYVPIRTAIAIALASLAAPAYAEHARITLDVESGGVKQTAFVDQTPPASGKNPRPILKVKAGAPIKIQWTFTNTYPHKTLEDVLVHSFVAKQEKAGQKELPPLDDDVVHETAFRMDFKPNGKAGERCRLKIDAPGAYLVRVEGRDSDGDHEHFAAIDLVVEPSDAKK